MKRAINNGKSYVVAGRILVDRPASIMFQPDEGGFILRKIWLPKSQIEISEDGQSIIIPEWLAAECDL